MGEKGPDLFSVFGRYPFTEEEKEIVKKCHIGDMRADRKKRVIDMTLHFEETIDKEILDKMRRGIAEVHALSELLIRVRYDGAAFDAGYFPQLVYHAKRTMGANGFFNGSAASFDGETLTVTLQNGGYALLKERNCEKELERVVREEFGTEIKVRFDGVLDIAAGSEEHALTQKMLEERTAAAAAPAPGSRSAAKGKKQRPGGAVIVGKTIKDAPVPMREVTQDSGRIAVKGEIFAVEQRESRDGRKLILSFDVTDYTSSLRVKYIAEREKAGEAAESIVEGQSVLLKGDVEFDRFERDLSVRLSDLMLAEREEPADDAPEKRVELHLHTAMSSMDGINPVEDYIRQAAAWGHKAVAVTDHGVVQSFPDAMKAGKKFGVKILYGVEAYFVNDTLPTVYGRKKNSLRQGDFVVFDIETTGLSARENAITEIGAVRLRGGQVVGEFSTFVNPGVHIPKYITELTGITDEMVREAPPPDEALRAFYDFCREDVLVAHNANFDCGFVRAAAERAGLRFDFTYIDTVPLCRFLYPELKRYKLDIVAEHLKLPGFDHHRAVADAKTLGEIFRISLEKLEKEHGVGDIAEINGIAAGGADFRYMPTYHQTILVRDDAGLKNLYRLISYSHINYFYKKPRILKSLLMQHREGLLIGTACDAGELYTAVMEGKPADELRRIGEFYDYFEIQPIGNTMHLIGEGRVGDVGELKEINRRICDLGEKLGKPVVATGDVHFLKPRDEIFRRILMAGQGFSDADKQAPLYLRATADMLDEFDYLGKEKALEVVVTNTNRVAGLCGEVKPTRDGKFPPKMENAEEELSGLVWDRAAEIYGDPLPERIRTRVEKELRSIVKNGFSVMYMIAQKLVAKSLADGYLVGSRGSVGSSLVAFLAGITEVNALEPHYVCPKCSHTEFYEGEEYSTGLDMPDRNCPVCSAAMKKDGCSIPFETFLGFEGEKEPDIDLNFSGEYQAKAHKYTETLFGEGYVFRAGTIGTLADKTAYGFVKKYLESKGMVLPKAEENRLTRGCTGVKRTTGQHPGGIIILPKDREIYEFCPVQRPADDPQSDIVTTHFDYHSIDQNLLKLDILGHDDPTMIRMLEDLTGVKASEMPLFDPDTRSLFVSTEKLGFTGDPVIGEIGTVAVPEFGTKFVRKMLEETRPTTFAELVNISGLSHGTDVWVNNAQDLIRHKTADLSTVICTRDDIMRYLISKGVEKKLAFTIMESVRKGKGLKDEWEEAMEARSVPKWYINSCKKIKYMFPKAHAVAYVMMGLRIAYCKVHYPAAFYAAYFTVRAPEFDAAFMIHGPEAAAEKMEEIERNPKATQKEKNMLIVLEVCYEMYRRGLRFLPVDLYLSESEKFLVTDEGIRPPLLALAGLGSTAAASIAEARRDGPFMTVEDLGARTGVSKTVIEILEASGALKDIPRTAQLSFF